MKAAVREKYVPPAYLQVKEFRKPVAKHGQLLIRVYATTVNRTDCAVLSGKPLIMRLFTGLTKPKSPVPGTDFAGQVEAVGRKVKQFRAGDKVWGFYDNGLASQAEYLTVAESGPVAIIPEGVSYEEAAASGEGAHYA